MPFSRLIKPSVSSRPPCIALTSIKIFKTRFTLVAIALSLTIGAVAQNQNPNVLITEYWTGDSCRGNTFTHIGNDSSNAGEPLEESIRNANIVTA